MPKCHWANYPLDCIEVADKKQLKFIGVVTAEAVAAVPAGDSSEAKGE